MGTLYQRHYCGKIDWRAGNLVQYIGVTIFFGLAAWLFEDNAVRWTTEFVLAMAWLVVVLSIGSIGLLYWLIRRSAATSVASLFYLVPAVTAVMAYLLFGERLDAIAMVGMAACARRCLHRQSADQARRVCEPVRSLRARPKASARVEVAT